ncbi:DEAD/DEAH box helicase [Kocuria salina]|uniref:DEAD/DEAH box helicase n=1 Tax=Kocuria salina TaxID=1929416 RepID=UPI001594ACAB|nr:DEAD/DEAH box helicase [Kocuria salina]
MSGQAPSLEITFGEGVTRARLSVREGFEEHLRLLALRIPSSIQRSPTTVEVGLDELLTNLVALGAWPEPATVTWDPHLAGLARDSALAARTVTDLLAAPDAAAAGPLPEEVESLLGGNWREDLAWFQRRDIARLLGLRHGANFSVPGAGKTRVALAVFEAARRAHGVERLLVVGPKSSYEAWQVENTACFHQPLQFQVYGGSVDPGAEAVIVNYERLGGAVNTLGRWLSARPSMLVLDEAHRMKLGAEGTYGAACLALGPRARQRLILTGTPAPNGVKDLQNLFGFVWPGYGRQRVTQAVSGGSLVQASQELKPLFTRTTKQELALPPVRTSLRRVQMPDLHQEIYEALLGQFSPRAAAAEDDFLAWGRIVIYLLMAATSPALLTVGGTAHEPLAYQVPPLRIPEGSRLQDLMADLMNYEMSPKYKEALAIVAANAAAGRKTLVWSTFVRSLNTLASVLRDFSPAVVHGGTPDREEQIARFRNDDDCMVLLSNPATLGEGVSLHQHCHDAVYIDRDFAAGKFLQSLDRIHRLGLPAGTETRVTVLATEGTIDEVVAQRLEDKLIFMGGILDDPAVQQLSDLDEEPAVGGGLAPADLRLLMGHLGAGPS